MASGMAYSLLLVEGEVEAPAEDALAVVDWEALVASAVSSAFRATSDWRV